MTSAFDMGKNLPILLHILLYHEIDSNKSIIISKVISVLLINYG